MMKDTQLWRIVAEASVEDANSNKNVIDEAANLLRSGGTVAFPTETVYGLGADARNADAVAAIFAAKGRPSDNPLIVHISDRKQLDELVLPYSELVERLMNRFWPGPLAFVLPARPGVLAATVTAGLSTVAIRMPANEVALRLITNSGCPIAAPSANRSGRPSPTQAHHVQQDLGGRIDGIVDGGPAAVGVESTVIEVVGQTIRILRPGGITAEELREVGSQVEEDSGALSALGEESPRSPGMKYTHYAPQGSMQLVKGNLSAVVSYINTEAAQASKHGERTGVLAFAEHADRFIADDVVIVGSMSEPKSVAHGLYAALRTFDDRQTDRIWAEACAEDGIGRALMNRLAKAAGHHIMNVD